MHQQQKSVFVRLSSYLHLYMFFFVDLCSESGYSICWLGEVHLKSD